jgi:hypothetical protein
MKLQTLSVVFAALVLAAPLSAQTLDPETELTLPPPWTQPVLLGALPEGRYRLEATTLGSDPVEVTLERKSPDSPWTASGTNRNLRGSLDGWVDLSPRAGDSWRVRPTLTVNDTVILRLRSLAFADLKDSLKQGLTTGPEVSSPLTKRLELPPATGGPGLAAQVGAGGALWLGWLTDGGWGAQVWDAQRGLRLGRELAARGGPWNALALGGTNAPVATLGAPAGATALAWSGADWTPASPADAVLSTPWGRFRTETAPVRVFRAQETGWQDLELPRDDQADLIVLGSSDDGLAAFLASSSSAHRAFYLWKPGLGWLAEPPPPASGPPWQDLWTVSAGAGTLYHLEGDDHQLLLRQFDGSEWRPALDLSVLAPQGARAAVLLPPSAWSKTGSLVVATDRVSVYDLP